MAKYVLNLLTRRTWMYLLRTDFTERNGIKSDMKVSRNLTVKSLKERDNSWAENIRKRLFIFFQDVIKYGKKTKKIPKF